MPDLWRIDLRGGVIVNKDQEESRLPQPAWLLAPIRKRNSQVAVFVALSLLVGCRFGGGTGPEEQASIDYGQVEQADDEDESGGYQNASGIGSDYAGSGPVGYDSDGSGAGGAGYTDSGSNGLNEPDEGLEYSDPDGSSSGSPGEPPDGTVDGTNCANRPQVTGCDPTQEGGCDDLPDLMQCVVDPFALTAARVCAFSTPMGEDFCFSTGMTESCPPTFTCYFGVCEELCLCDEDCSVGRCSGDPIGDKGFRICADF